MQVDKSIIKLKKIVKNQIEKKNYEIALTVAKTLSGIYYDYNQIYTDIDLEDELLTIRDAILEKRAYENEKQCVLFYDGFGLDIRGWAASYVKTLSSLGYYLIYLCPKCMEGKIPHIISELDSKNSEIVYFDDKGKLVDKTKYIDLIFKKYRPCVAFFYTTPNDVCAAIAFSNNAATVRIQVDLTDHAYWIGINAFDYIIECRNMGASLALYERNIKFSQILKLDCAPYVTRDKVSSPLPFNIYKEKYIFTGGALYKTLGDKELLYYKTVSYILDRYKYIKFLYAGNGDDIEIKKLIIKYPNRVFHIDERNDFFEIIRNSVLYLNSYPMFGGLMMRYAAIAHKVPVTLKHDHDADGILIDQDKLGIEFDDYRNFLNEIDKLLSDEEYRKIQEEKVKNAVISEKDFAYNINLIIKERRTEYAFKKINRFDTTNFREEYRKRYKYSTLCKSIARKGNICLLKYFPKEYLLGLVIKIKNYRIIRNVKN